VAKIGTHFMMSRAYHAKSITVVNI